MDDQKRQRILEIVNSATSIDVLKSELLGLCYDEKTINAFIKANEDGVLKNLFKN